MCPHPIFSYSYISIFLYFYNSKFRYFYNALFPLSCVHMFRLSCMTCACPEVLQLYDCTFMHRRSDIPIFLYFYISVFLYFCISIFLYPYISIFLYPYNCFNILHEVRDNHFESNVNASNVDASWNLVHQPEVGCKKVVG